MKLSQKDIDEFIKDGKEKPILYKNGKQYIPSDAGYNIRQVKSVRKNRKK